MLMDGQVCRKRKDTHIVHLLMLYSFALDIRGMTLQSLERQKPAAIAQEPTSLTNLYCKQMTVDLYNNS